MRFSKGLAVRRPSIEEIISSEPPSRSTSVIWRRSAGRGGRRRAARGEELGHQGLHLQRLERMVHL